MRKRPKQVSIGGILSVCLVLLLFYQGSCQEVPKIEVLFSPEQGKEVLQTLKDTIQNAEERVYIFIYSFTLDELAQTIIERHREGLDVKVIMDKGQTSSKWAVTEKLRNVGIPLVVKAGSQGGYMHIKALIADDTLFTGSYNYSNNATYRNDENLLIIRDTNIVEAHVSRFNELWGEGIPAASLPAKSRSQVMSLALLEFFEPIISNMQVSDWILLAVVASAFLAPYVIERWKDRRKRPRLVFEFGFGPGEPYSHQTVARNPKTKDSYPVYYFLFSVRNRGRAAADDCEAILEGIWEEHAKRQLHLWRGFLPVNLKWAGESPGRTTVYPDQRRFCNIGHINSPNELQRQESAYAGATKEEQAKTKFFFEQRWTYNRQWDCLLPRPEHPYYLQISVYSKNMKSLTRVFRVTWSGEWSLDDGVMLSDKGVVLSCFGRGGSKRFIEASLREERKKQEGAKDERAQLS